MLYSTLICTCNLRVSLARLSHNTVTSADELILPLCGLKQKSSYAGSPISDLTWHDACRSLHTYLVRESCKISCKLLLDVSQ